MKQIYSTAKKYPLLALILLITITWVILYRDFIFGSSYYLYSDVGSDDINNYLPHYEFIINLIKTQNFSGWSFNLGTGNDVFSLFLLLLDPFIFILLIPVVSLPSLILLMTYTKIICIAILFYKYLQLFDRNHHISLIISVILFSFNSFIVIWGQHYFFLTGVFYFIFLLYGVEYFFRYSRVTLLSISLVLFLSGSLYCFFFSLPFFTVYIAYRILQDKDLKDRIFNLKLKIILIISFSILLSLWSILPVLNVLMSSPRTGMSFNFPLFYDTRYILVSLSRFYNVIWLGVNDYHGTSNFYEDRQVYVSCLFPLLLLPYLFSDKKRIFTKSCLIALCLLPLIFPFFDGLFNKFSSLYTRYMFFYAFLEVLVIRDILKKTINRNSIFISLIINIIILIILGKNLNLYHSMNFYLVNFFIALYALLLIINTRISLIILLFVTFSEILYFNNIAVYSSRVTLKANIVTNHSSYFDGTDEVSDWVKHHDHGFYRLYRNYISIFMNDQAYFAYNGFDTYNSLSNPYYNQFRNSLDIRNGYINQTWKIQEVSTINNGLDNHPLMYSFLSAKYFIAKKNYHQVPYGYVKLKEFNDYTLYENKMFLPAGLFYNSEMCTTTGDYTSANNKQKENMLANSYVVDNCTQLSVKNQSNIINNNSILNDHDIKNYTLRESIDNVKNTKSIFIIFGNIESYVEIKMHFNIDKSSNQENLDKSITAYVGSSTGSYNDYDKVKFNVDDFGNVDAYIEFDKIKNIKIPIDDKAYSLGSIKISKRYLMQYEMNIADLTNRHVGFEYNIDSPNVFRINKYFSHDGMIILPIPFNKYWHVEVDGKPQTTHLVDNGLLGVFVTKGNHLVKFYYRNDAFLLGVIISITSLLLIALFLGFNKIREIYRKVVT